MGPGYQLGRVTLPVVMALVSKNSINPIFLLNVFLTSITLVVIGYFLKFYVPIFIEVSVSGAPLLWTSLSSWFTPSYLFLVVNFIIVAIAASSRFQHRSTEGVSATKIQLDDTQKESYDDVGRKNSFEYKAEFEGMVTEMYRHLDGKQVEVKKKKPVEVVVKARKKLVEFTPETYGRVEVKDLNVKEQKKQAQLISEPRRVLEVRTPKKWRELGLPTPKKGRSLDVNIKRETENPAKKSEDTHARSKSSGMPNQMNTIEIPTDYSYSEEKSRISDEVDHQDVLAGEEEKATETEENDTLDGTWKMIMESRRLHEAGLQEDAMRSPSQSTTKKQERFNR
ncbi:hypothetical protein ACHQM5_029443 [Ranunculus cassubicifolius]